jgi:hypothetical protein
MTSLFLANVFFAICDSLSPRMGPGRLQTLKNHNKSSNITKTNKNCSMTFGRFLCIVQAGGGSSRGSSSRQSSRQKSLHSACFSAVVSQRSATISAVNSTCSCQGVEECGDDTPQASSLLYTCTTSCMCKQKAKETNNYINRQVQCTRRSWVYPISSNCIRALGSLSNLNAT